MKKKYKILILVLIVFSIGAMGVMVGHFLKNENKDLQNISDIFMKKDIYSEDLYENGIDIRRGAKTFVERCDPEKGEAKSIVIPVEYGKTYEMYFDFPRAMERLFVAVADSDPAALAAGESLSAKELCLMDRRPSESDLSPLVYIPQKEKEFLVISMSKTKTVPLRILEQVILAAEDTEGPWYRPSGVGDFLGNADSFADYRWSSSEVYANLYEPLRERYPSYIKREHIGKDASDTYDMYAYIFAPEDYEQTVFLSGGMHANEEEGYFALAYFMGEVANAKKSNAQLSYLRERVRFIVVPMINVFGVSQTHDLTKANWAIRYNSTETDLNRDFEAQTQQETKNVAALLEKYGADISFGIDFHTTPNDNGSDLFFNFSVGTDNAPANYSTTNHIYHRMVEEGMITEKRPLLVPSSSSYGNLGAVNGKYASARTLQAYLWNAHGIPPLTVEYMNFTSGKSPAKGSAEGLSMAVEIFGNFIIQNALFFASVEDSCAR